MSDGRNAILDELARRVAARTGLDRAAAEQAVQDARYRRGEHLTVVTEEFHALFEERVRPVLDTYGLTIQRMARALRAARTALGPVSEALDAIATAEARDGLREHERGLRFAHRHPDMAELDELLEALYDKPGG